jgi:hypothetical protein
MSLALLYHDYQSPIALMIGFREGIWYEFRTAEFGVGSGGAN